MNISIADQCEVYKACAAGTGYSFTVGCLNVALSQSAALILYILPGKEVLFF